MKSLAPRSSWVITIGLVAVSIGYLYFVFIPARRNIEKLREEVTQKQAYLTQLPGLKSSLASAELELSHTQQYVDQWRSKAPVAGELSSTYGAIHRLVTAAGVEVGKFDPQNVTNLETVRKIPIRLTAGGSFVQLHALLRGLEQMPASPWVENLRIERGKDAEAPLKGERTLAIFAADPEISD